MRAQSTCLSSFLSQLRLTTFTESSYSATASLAVSCPAWVHDCSVRHLMEPCGPFGGERRGDTNSGALKRCKCSKKAKLRSTFSYFQCNVFHYTQRFQKRDSENIVCRINLGKFEYTKFGAESSNFASRFTTCLPGYCFGVMLITRYSFFVLTGWSLLTC